MMAVIEVGVESAATVRDRLEEFGRGVLAEAVNRPAQMANGSLYLRGLVEDGKRKSLEPMVARLGDDADYQSMQQFLGDSPWVAAAVVQAVAERVAPAVEVEAWVLDDTGFPSRARARRG
jgi:SRSO17 transposase